LSYSKSHVILIAFAIDTPDSLENVTVKVSWTRFSFIQSEVDHLLNNIVDRRGAINLRTNNSNHPRWLQVRPSTSS
jgi:hypothetical protein